MLTLKVWPIWIGGIRIHALVVGGSGMLADVCVWLAEQGYTVSVIGRRPERFDVLRIKLGSQLDSIHPLVVDYHEPETLRRTVSEALSKHGPIELAVFWIHTDAGHAFGVIAEQISSSAVGSWRLFHVRGSSAYLHPHSPTVPWNCLYRPVILGFIVDSTDSRWLTHQEISTGVITAIEQDTERFVVGTLEPWDKRPV